MPMYNLADLKSLIETIDRSSVTEIKLENEQGEKLVIKKDVQVVAQPQTVSMVQETAAISANPASPVAEPVQAAPQGKIIESPMAGVFYAAPAPDAAPYAVVGQSVKEGDTVCIVEAMKLMNEITATENGTIQEILVENGQIVEYGQPLFSIG